MASSITRAIASMRVASRSLVLSLLLVLVGAVPGTAQDDVKPPTLGATVRPSVLNLLAADFTTSTQIGNAGSVTASLSAVVNLPSTRIEAEGWTATVESEVLEPGGWATVALTIDGAYPSDVSLDIFMEPVTSQGTEGVVLRFPIAVDVEAATAESTGMAWVRSIWHYLEPVWLDAWFGT